MQVESQKAVFPFVGVTRKLGDATLASMGERFRDDKEVMAVAKAFAMQCSAAWVQVWGARGEGWGGEWEGAVVVDGGDWVTVARGQRKGKVVDGWWLVVASCKLW